MSDNQSSFQYLLVLNFLQDRMRVKFKLIGIAFNVKSSRYWTTPLKGTTT